MTRVRRAVFLAAGAGRRLRPATDHLPKPLVRVNGRPIIETTLDAVAAAGIRDITIVRGYLGEAFDSLRPRYPGLRFLDNADYAAANNIGSVALAGDLLANAYVIESDLLLRDPSLIAPWQEESNYLAVAVGRTDDWYFQVDSAGYVRELGVGCDGPCRRLVGISYWTEADGRRLAARARELYADPANRQLFWDEVALSRFLPEFRVRTRLCPPDAVAEIDTYDELRALDSSYPSYP